MNLLRPISSVYSVVKLFAGIRENLMEAKQNRKSQRAQRCIEEYPLAHSAYEALMRSTYAYFPEA
jgi:hypothetical protein